MDGIAKIAWQARGGTISKLTSLCPFWFLIFILGFVASSVLGHSFLFAQSPQDRIRVEVRRNLDSLLQKEDTDGDKRITVDDSYIVGTQRGDKRFWLVATDKRRYEVSGTYYLSNLLQELKLAEDAGYDTIKIDPERIFESPVHRISRSIRELYWDGLTRRIDERHLAQIFSDPKTASVDGFHYIYVPHTDTIAYEYFSKIARKNPELKIKVVRLLENITAEYVRSLNGYHGILSLALVHTSDGDYEGVPFVVPGGRFNEMYGWDSYFEALGLLEDGRVDLAKAMVDNFVYEIRYYGKLLNANRTYYLLRSQPPFLTSMALATYRHLPKDSVSKEWLKIVLEAAVKEYHEVWMNKDRLTNIGLSRYDGSGIGPPPEVEPGHFDVVYAPYAEKLGMDIRSFEKAYTSGKITIPELDRYFVHDRAMRESGHDTSYRLEGLCADLVTVDLNSLLYKIEMDIAQTIEKEFSGVLAFANGKVEKSSEWYKRAEKRRELVNCYLWNAERGMFFDYDFVHKRTNTYVSATTFYPLWAGLASREQAASLVENALPLLEMPGGIVSSTEESRGPISDKHPARQWDYPNGWAPHQMLIWRGLLNYGYEDVAHRCIYRWLYTITRNAVDYNGTIPEKFDVVNRSHQVFAEYGNVGTKFSYITREGFGWMNASFQVGLRLLPQELREKLDHLIPPEWIFQK